VDKDNIKLELFYIIIFANPRKIYSTRVAAEKEFYRSRQKFGKERRKFLQSLPRSGASGDNVVYKSNWILYNLMFLADHIQPRQ